MPVIPSSRSKTSNFSKSVFINCPFDNEFKPLFNALLFAILDCGFDPKFALQDVGAKESRLDKIQRMIKESRFSIHDLSRVQINTKSPLPRFNMPFELGLAWGAMQYTPRQMRNLLVVVGEPYQDKRTLSDIAGIDSESHSNDAKILIAKTRKFLASNGSATVPIGASLIASRFDRFQRSIVIGTKKSKDISLKEINSWDYVNDWASLAAKWIKDPKND
jgi:hypothetical protein